MAKFKNRTEVNPKIELDKNESIEGLYLESKVCMSKEGEEFNVHCFEVDELPHDIMGCGSLDYQILGKTKNTKKGKELKPLKAGDLCRITYNGTVDIVDASGKKRTGVHQYNLAVAED